MSLIHNTVSWKDSNRLINNLRAWGVKYLVGFEQTPSSHDRYSKLLHPIELIALLAQQNENSRIRDASISLFLLHPELSHDILDAMHSSKPEVSEQIITSVLAALYLQRMWSIRLALALRHPSNFPEEPFTHLWQHRHLPPPSFHNGEWGLVALQTYEQSRTGMPFFFQADWQNQLDHLLWQEEKRHQNKPLFLPSHILLNEDTESQEFEMSMRPNVDKKAIDLFLQEVGRTIHKLGRLYLVGGAALVHAGVRSGFTQGIDIQVGATNECDLVIGIQKLIQQMQINVEFASPQDFIPLPAQWESHAQYVGRYGQIDVFYFDFYSIALSKIERGSTRDIEDVKLLVQQHFITLQELDTAYKEVLAQLGKGHYPKITPERFATRYATILPLL